MTAAQGLERRARWRWPEIVFWLVAFGALLMPSGKYLILNEIAILALFALSLDLILGYAGIVSLGHAAFFGVGAYTAGLLAKHVTRRSAGRARRSDRGRRDRGLPHQLPGAARQRSHAPDGDAGRGAGAGRDRQRLPAHHRRRRRPAGRRHGQAAGPLRVRPVRPHRLRLQPDDAVRADAAGAARRAFAVRPVADVDPPQPAARRGARRAGPFAPDRGLHARRRLCRRGRRAARPDHGLRLARRLRVPSLGRSSCWC